MAKTKVDPKAIKSAGDDNPFYVLKTFIENRFYDADVEVIDTSSHDPYYIRFHKLVAGIKVCIHVGWDREKDRFVIYLRSPFPPRYHKLRNYSLKARWYETAVEKIETLIEMSRPLCEDIREKQKKEKEINKRAEQTAKTLSEEFGAKIEDLTSRLSSERVNLQYMPTKKCWVRFCDIGNNEFKMEFISAVLSKDELKQLVHLLGMSGDVVMNKLMGGD